MKPLALALALLAAPALAQEAEEMAYVNVDGAAVEATLAQAAAACGMDEAAVREAAGLGATPNAEVAAEAATEEAPAEDDEVSTAQGDADPSTTEPGDTELLALAVCEIDVETAGDHGIAMGDEIVTE